MAEACPICCWVVAPLPLARFRRWWPRRPNHNSPRRGQSSTAPRLSDDLSKRHPGESELRVSTDYCTARVCHTSRVTLLHHHGTRSRALRGPHPSNYIPHASSNEDKPSTALHTSRPSVCTRRAAGSASPAPSNPSGAAAAPPPPPLPTPSNLGYPASYRRPVTALAAHSRVKRKRNHTTSSDASHADHLVLPLLLHRWTTLIIIIIIMPSQRTLTAFPRRV